MAIVKKSNRQYPLVAKVDFAFSDFVSGIDVSAIDLPGNARVIGGALGVTTVFNSAGGTTPADSVAIGDGTTYNRFGAINVRALGRTALTVDQLPHGGVEATLRWTPNGDTTTAPTTGAGYLEIEYVLEGRGNEVQP